MAAPSQWEGWTSDNRQIYIRYRWGILSINIGEVGDKAEMAAVDGEEIFTCNVGGQYDGLMNYATLKELTKDIIKLPDYTDAKDGKWLC